MLTCRLQRSMPDARYDHRQTRSGGFLMNSCMMTFTRVKLNALTAGTLEHNSSGPELVTADLSFKMTVRQFSTTAIYLCLCDAVSWRAVKIVFVALLDAKSWSEMRLPEFNALMVAGPSLVPPKWLLIRFESLNNCSKPVYIRNVKCLEFGWF